MHTVTCDRCGDSANWQDHHAYDYMRDNYPALAGQDICQRCFERIEFAGTVASLAAAAGVSQKQYLKDWLKLYEET